MSSHLLRAALVMAAVLLFAGCASNTRPGAPLPAPSPTTSSTTTTPEHTPYVPKPEDFQLTVTVLEQQCFGSAGCNVTFSLEVGYSGSYMRAGEGPYQIVYNVAGTDDGAFIGRFTLQPPDQFTVTEEYVSTPPGGTLTATVTQVL